MARRLGDSNISRNDSLHHLSTKVALEQGPRVAGLVLVNPIYLHDDRRLALLPMLRHVVPWAALETGRVRAN